MSIESQNHPPVQAFLSGQTQECGQKLPILLNLTEALENIAPQISGRTPSD